MNEFNEPTVLPPFGELFADSAPTDDALQRMLDIAVDPSMPDLSDSLVPDSQDVALDDFDEHVSLDDGEVPTTAITTTPTTPTTTTRFSTNRKTPSPAPPCPTPRLTTETITPTSSRRTRPAVRGRSCPTTPWRISRCLVPRT